MQYAELLSAEDRAFYDEFVEWLDLHLPPFQERWGVVGRRGLLDTMKAWHQELYAGGWVGVTWPKEYGGRGASGTQQVAMELELAARRAPRGLGQISVERVGPALILHGTKEQQERFLPPIQRGDWVWCQGFSEPDAGSDLAALKTRAERVEGGYRVNGQKIWTSNAFFSDRMWLLARTDPDAPKHRGISAFIVDLPSPAIEVRPIRQLTGEQRDRQTFGDQFNEVFFTDLFVPGENRVGAENQGWSIARSTLVRERATNVSSFFRDIKSTLSAVEKLTTDADVAALYDGDLAFLEDTVVDHRILLAGLEHMYEQSVMAMLSGEQVGGETSVAKLLASELQQRVNELALSVAGPYGLYGGNGPETFKGGRAALGYLRSRGATIGGGTSEIQRNWIAQRVLGLQSR